MVPKAAEMHKGIGSVALHAHDAQVSAKVACIGARNGQAVSKPSEGRPRVEVRRSTWMREQARRQTGCFQV